MSRNRLGCTLHAQAATALPSDGFAQLTNTYFSAQTLTLNYCFVVDKSSQAYICILLCSDRECAKHAGNSPRQETGRAIGTSNAVMACTFPEHITHVGVCVGVCVFGVFVCVCESVCVLTGPRAEISRLLWRRGDIAVKVGTFRKQNSPMSCLIFTVANPMRREICHADKLFKVCFQSVFTQTFLSRFISFSKNEMFCQQICTYKHVYSNVTSIYIPFFTALHINSLCFGTVTRRVICTE